MDPWDSSKIQENVGSPEETAEALCQYMEDGREERLLLASGREVQRITVLRLPYLCASA